MFEKRYSYFRFEWSFCCSRASAKTNILRLSSTTNRGSEANSKSDIWGVLWIVRNYFILHWSEFKILIDFRNWEFKICYHLFSSYFSVLLVAISVMIGMPWFNFQYLIRIFWPPMISEERPFSLCLRCQVHVTET